MRTKRPNAWSRVASEHACWQSQSLESSYWHLVTESVQQLEYASESVACMPVTPKLLSLQEPNNSNFDRFLTISEVVTKRS